jgi:hypothetical protein
MWQLPGARVADEDHAPALPAQDVDDGVDVSELDPARTSPGFMPGSVGASTSWPAA